MGVIAVKEDKVCSYYEEGGVVDADLTARFEEGFQRTTEGIVIMADVALEVRNTYGYKEYVRWLERCFGLRERMGTNLLQVARNLTAKFAVDWRRFGISALYVLASPSAPSEAIEEAIALAEGGELVTHAIAQGIIRRVKRMNEVLGQSSEDVTTFVAQNAIDDPDIVDTLNRLEKSSNVAGSLRTFDEIMATGGFHYGEEGEQWCDIANDSAKKRIEALNSLSAAHRNASPSPKTVAIAALVDAAHGLTRYRKSAGSVGFELEKADSYIEAMTRALAILDNQ